MDPKLIKDNPQIIRDMLKARAVDFDLDAFIEFDQKRRDFILKTDDLKNRKNQMAKMVSQQKKEGQDITNILNDIKNISSDIIKIESEQQVNEERYNSLARTIPNLVDKSVPIGTDYNANQELRKWHSIPSFDFKINDHVDILEKLNLIDFERAAKVAGARFYYMKNDLVKLNQSLIYHALDFLSSKEYSLIQPPYMINRESMEGAVITNDFKDAIYKIEDEDLYMIGTSEHAIAAMHSHEIIDGNNLPIRYAGVSPCFRKEAGVHGKDEKGIFRVHQFDKIEQFVFARPEDSWNEHERMLNVSEEFYQGLEIPYRVMVLSSGDMGKVAAKTYDIEAWLACQNRYREVVSCSNCLDYQARRLKIRFRDRTNDDTQYLHTLNSTLIATTRILISIIENFQTKDGHVKIPKILQKYMKGQKEI